MYSDKRNLCQQMGLRLPVRDLRVLDPAFTTQGSGCVLVREKCIVVALEHVRIIVMKDRVLVPKGEAFSPHEANLMKALERHTQEYSRTGISTFGHSASQHSLTGLANAGAPGFNPSHILVMRRTWLHALELQTAAAPRKPRVVLTPVSLCSQIRQQFWCENQRHHPGQVGQRR